MAELQEHPPYFKLMERLNLEGAKPVAPRPVPTAFGAQEFARVSQDSVIVDVRGTSAFLGAHVPDSLAIPVDMVPAFAGWLLDPDSDLVLVAKDEAQASTAARYLARIGYDRVQGFLTTDLTSWATEARPFRSVPIVNVNEVARRVTDAPSDWVLLDVRSETEVAEETIEGALSVYVGELPGRTDSLKSFKSITVVCESGARATIAASVLLRAGHSDVDVFLGSMGAWETAGYDTSCPS